MKYQKKRKAELLIGLWNQCNNRCRFCYNQTLLHLPLDLNAHLKMCNDLLHSNFIENFDYLRFLGGELFDGSMDKLGVTNEYLKIIQSSLELLKTGKIEKINFLTNLIYENRDELKQTLEMFEREGLIDKIELSTSYDIVGRFNYPNSEKWWWDNIKWINTNYPKMKIDIGIIMTQPFITMVTKDWLDWFCDRIKNRYIYLIELDTAILRCDKEHSPFKDLFPKRSDFLIFLKNLKQWNYYDLLIKPDGSDPWSNVDSIQLVHLEEFPFPVFKNQHFLLEQRETFKEDGYIDSDVPLFDDVKKMLQF